MTIPRITHVTALPVKGGQGPVGGVGTYSASLLELLSRAPFEHTVLCNRDADGDRIATLPANVHALPTWTFDRFDMPRVIARAVEVSQPQLIHLQQELFLYGRGPKALLFPLLLRRLRRRHEVVVTVHGVTTSREIDENLLAGRRTPVPLAIVRPVIVGIFRSIARSGAHLVVHSETLRERLIELGAKAERITVIPHLLFTQRGDAARLTRAQAREKLGIPAHARVVLTWGYWNGYKGLDVLVDGFARYRAADSDALLVLGTGPHPQLRNDAAYIATYDEAMKHLSRGEGVRHAGFIPDDHLNEYIAAADVCVFAYTKHLAASGPATLAVTLGAPLLLSTVFDDAPREIAFEPNPTALADALGRFFADPLAHEAAASAMRERAADATILDAYTRLYTKLTSR